MITVHGPVWEGFLEYYRALAPDVSMVAISEAQRRLAPDLPWVGTVHNAIRLDDYPFSAKKHDFVLFLGRIRPEKGAHVAIDAARAAGLRLVLAGTCSGEGERRYFEEEVRPRLGPDADWVEEADAQTKKDLLARARCLLFPIQWDEPFGLVMIEAMACGTPVVGLRFGAVPEVVVDGVTGFVVDSPEDVPGAIDRAGGLDPAACRADVKERFDVPRMAEQYEAVYRHLAGLRRQ